MEASFKTRWFFDDEHYAWCKNHSDIHLKVQVQSYNIHLKISFQMLLNFFEWKTPSIVKDPTHVKGNTIDWNRFTMLYYQAGSKL